MAKKRRIGALTSETRTSLLNAAEELMREQGYAAVSSRVLAARAGLKPQLVHYYFRNMDELFLALWRRRADKQFQRQDEILTSPKPLKAAWNLSTDPNDVVLSYEFVALANHRKAIQAEIAAFGDRLRARQVKILKQLVKDKSDALGWSPIVMIMVIDSLARMLAIENALGMKVGHAKARAAISRLIKQIER
jgi:TetR/AcrR family transcriptional regulator